MSILFKHSLIHTMSYSLIHTVTNDGPPCKVTVTARHYCRRHLFLYPYSSVYGHITLKAPVLVRSLKLSNVEPG